MGESLKNNFLSALLILAIFGGGGFLVSDLIMTKFFSPSEENIQEVLFDFAEEMNKQCPMTVDAGVRLDNVAILSQRTVQYNYTLTSQKKEDVDLEEMKEVYPKLVNDLKTNPDMEAFRELKVTLSYYYKDKNGVYVAQFKIRPHQYLN